MRYLIFALLIIIGCTTSKKQKVSPAAFSTPWQAWPHDSKDTLASYGAFLMNQDGANNRESMIHTDTLLAVFRDSIGGATTAATVTAVDNIRQIVGATYNLGDRIVVKPTGAEYFVQTDTVDNFPVDSVAVIPTSSAYAVLRPQNGELNVDWFGAIGDNSNNDTEEIQNAVDFATFLPGDVVTGFRGAKVTFSPNKHYLTDSIIIERRNLILDGQNCHLTGFTRGDSTNALIQVGTDIFNAFHVLIRDIFIGGNGKLACIQLYRSDFGRIENVKLGGAKYGIYLGERECVSTYIENVNITGCDIGIYAVKNSDSNPNSSYINGGKIFNGSIGGIQIDAGTSISISNLDISLYPRFAIKLGTDSTSVSRVNLSNIYTEANGSGLVGDTSSTFILTNVTDFRFENCDLGGANGTVNGKTHMQYAVKLKDSHAGMFHNCSFSLIQDAHIFADSMCTNISVDGFTSSRLATQYDRENRGMIRMVDQTYDGIDLRYFDKHSFNRNGSTDSLKNYIDPDTRNYTAGNSSLIGSEYCELINDTVGVFTFKGPTQGTLEQITETFPTSSGFARVKFVAKLISIDDPVQDLGQFAVTIIRSNGFSGTPYKNNIELDYDYRFYDLIVNLNRDAKEDTLLAPYTVDVPFTFRFSKPGLDSITVAVGGVQITTVDDDFYYHRKDDQLSKPSFVVQDPITLLDVPTFPVMDSALTIVNGLVGLAPTVNIYNASDTMVGDITVHTGGNDFTIETETASGLRVNNTDVRALGTFQIGDNTTSGAVFKLRSSSNEWQYWLSGTSFLLEPQITNSSIRIRDVENVTIFDLTTAVGRMTMNDDGGNPIFIAHESNEFRINKSDDAGAFNLQVEGDSWINGDLTVTQDRILLGAVELITGTGSPENTVIAPVGSIYLRDDGGANTTLYLKESGAGNTGWIAK